MRSRKLDVGRYEYKYAVPASLRDEILGRADAYCTPDPHGRDIGGGARGYIVHSLYFDTPDLADYTARLAAKEVRVRLRVRTYGAPGDGAPVFLEDKRKLGCQVIKHRVKIGDAETWTGNADPRPWRAMGQRIQGRGRYAVDHFLRRVDDEGRTPVSVVHYRREVFVDRNPERRQVRLTLDYDITGSVSPGPHDLYAPPDIFLIPQDWMVVELKFGGDRPGWMRKLVRELGLISESVSKFGLSVALGRRAHRPSEVRYLTPISINRAARTR